MNLIANRRCCSTPTGSSMIIFISALVVVSQLVGGMYTPKKGYYPEADSSIDTGEEDDMDQIASTPKRNRGENNNESPDGYEENEPDGPYEESPREEEGQADLEKFFDDHLGASERDGMDKENLPTNLASIIQLPVNPPRVASEDGNEEDDIQASGSLINAKNLPFSKEPHKSDSYFPNLNRQRHFIKSPTKNVLITRESTHPLRQIDRMDREGNNINKPNRHQSSRRGALYRGRKLRAGSNTRRLQEDPDGNDNNVIAIENDDDDRIYFTNKTNQPFKIDALGGYDPEEDFKNASRDLEDPGIAPMQGTKSRRKMKEKSSNQRDVIFNDSENDGPSEDASETDEVTFSTDNPYKRDQLEDEIKSSATRRNDKVDGEDSEQSTRSPIDNDSEDTVKGWVNDGIEDMEIPSQSDQDIVLEKAARMEELAQERRDREKERRDKEKENAQQENEQPEEHSQRMPNADYLKGDLGEDEFEDS